MMSEEIREKLHTLLDQIIDEDKYIGQIDEMKTREEEGKYVYDVVSYQLAFAERKLTLFN